MQIMPLKQEEEVLTTQLHKQPTKASREDFGRLIIAKLDVLLSKLLPKDTISGIQAQESNQIMSYTPMTPPISPTTPPISPKTINSYSCCRDKQRSLSSLTSKTRKSNRHIPLKYSYDRDIRENGKRVTYIL